MSATTALVLVSHSRALAAGCVEVAAQMAPDVDIRAAGGTDDGGIGTSYDLVEVAVTGALQDGAGAVVLLTDLGSAALTAESVLEILDDARVRQADAPFVEGAVAAAVAAQGGDDGNQVIAAARTAVDSFIELAAPQSGQSGPDPKGAPSGADEPATDALAPVERTLTVCNRLGLHARPAAMLARLAAEMDATVRVNGVDATSVLALMGLGLTGGASVHLDATGPAAEQAVETIAAEIEAGFGEE